MTKYRYNRFFTYRILRNGQTYRETVYDILDYINAEYPAITLQEFEAASPGYVEARGKALEATIIRCNSYSLKNNPAAKLDFDISPSAELQFGVMGNARVIQIMSTEDDVYAKPVFKNVPDWLKIVQFPINPLYWVFSTGENRTGAVLSAEITVEQAFDCGISRTIKAVQDGAPIPVIAYDETTALSFGLDADDNDTLIITNR